MKYESKSNEFVSNFLISS